MSMRGFTLFEILLYLALLSILMAGCISTLLHLAAASGRIHAAARLTDEGLFLLERMQYTASRAAAGAELKASHAGALTLGGGHTYDTFRLDRGALVHVTDQGYETLTENRTTATDLDFEQLTPATVQVSLTLQSPTGNGLVLEARFSDTLHLNPPPL